MPMFRIWWPERGQTREDAMPVRGFDAESAANNWADWYDYDSSDYAIVGGEIAEIMVLADGDSEPVKMTVHGEMTRTYRARAATTQPAPAAELGKDQQ